MSALRSTDTHNLAGLGDKIDYYPRDAHAGGAGGEGEAYSRANVARSEEVQVPRGLARALRRKGPTSRSLRRRTM